jgi:D-arabinose 1-dehydrogenase-like Zn-dependent alcohol dehydrogenase
MPESMAAVVNHGPGDYRLEEVPRPHARPGEVVIQVEAAGVCGSDAKCHAGAAMLWGGPDPWVTPPVIPGHEFFGTVVEIGEGAAEAHGVCSRVTWSSPSRSTRARPAGTAAAGSTGCARYTTSTGR